jgi:hypothetical protein
MPVLLEGRRPPVKVPIKDSVFVPIALDNGESQR